MRIRKSTFIHPGSNATYGMVAIALSFFAFAYSSRFGQAAILVYYALWFPLVLIDYRRVLGSYSKQLWIFAFGVFTCLSIFWSVVPPVTARAAIQYMTHIICALIAVRTLDIRTLTRGAIAGTSIVLLYSMLFGYYALDAIDGTYSFVGAFDSKNQLGFYASLGIYFAFAAVFILGERRIWLLGAGVVGLMAAYCLLASQSATSVLVTGLVVMLSIGMRVILFLSPKQRKKLFATAAISGIILVVAGVYLGAVDLVLGAFGKELDTDRPHLSLATGNSRRHDASLLWDRLSGLLGTRLLRAGTPVGGILHHLPRRLPFPQYVHRNHGRNRPDRRLPAGVHIADGGYRPPQAVSQRPQKR